MQNFLKGGIVTVKSDSSAPKNSFSPVKKKKSQKLKTTLKVIPAAGTGGKTEERTLKTEALKI